MTTFGYQRVQKVSNELSPEFEKFDNEISEQVNERMENSCRKKLKKILVIEGIGLLKTSFKTSTHLNKELRKNSFN